jgi:hypothetical protein
LDDERIIAVRVGAKRGVGGAERDENLAGTV